MREIIQGDCLEKLKDLADNSVDSIVTDPPYGLSFMGKKWDYDVPSKEVWKECLRVLKPGGYLLSFAGTRTQHRMAVNIEDAGFEIRDMIAWVYGSGFPKSLNIGKAVDKLQGNKREEYEYEHPQRKNRSANYSVGFSDSEERKNEGGSKIMATKGTSEWEGWGTALKPALEPITVARKPLAEKTVAENVLKYGTGGINIDGSRVGTEDNTHRKNKPYENDRTLNPGSWKEHTTGSDLGRFPANLIHDGSDEVVSLFPDTKSGSHKAGQPRNAESKTSYVMPNITTYSDNGSSGSAARFFYCAKASKADRDEGLEGFEEERHADRNIDDGVGGDNPRNRTNNPRKNHHPTVKPTKLMQYLVKLVTQKGGVVLDPFMGSGSTGKACKIEGFDFIGIELDPEYVKIAEARIKAVSIENILF